MSCLETSAEVINPGVVPLFCLAPAILYVVHKPFCSVALLSYVWKRSNIYKINFKLLPIVIWVMFFIVLPEWLKKS